MRLKKEHLSLPDELKLAATWKAIGIHFCFGVLPLITLIFVGSVVAYIAYPEQPPSIAGGLLFDLMIFAVLWLVTYMSAKQIKRHFPEVPKDLIITVSTLAIVLIIVAFYWYAYLDVAFNVQYLPPSEIDYVGLSLGSSFTAGIYVLLFVVASIITFRRAHKS